MADAGQSDLEGVKRACADVAVNDAERCQRQKPGIAVTVRRSALAGARRDLSALECVANCPAALTGVQGRTGDC